jgi:hypothetical protein
MSKLALRLAYWVVAGIWTTLFAAAVASRVALVILVGYLVWMGVEWWIELL